MPVPIPRAWTASAAASGALSVPHPKDREAIVLSTHRLGHFGLNPCHESITKKGYYWRTLSKDIERAINACAECQKFKITPTFNHPAQALNISGIFDRVGVDLVLGLPRKKAIMA
jgi:hypothetical protein